MREISSLMGCKEKVDYSCLQGFIDLTQFEPKFIIASNCHSAVKCGFMTFNEI